MRLFSILIAWTLAAGPMLGLGSMHPLGTISGLAVAATPWYPGVKRSTVDPRADLLVALVRHQRFDEATDWCDAALQEVTDGSEEAAWWMIQRCRAETAREMTAEEFDDGAIGRAQRGLAGLLESYPDHPRRLFLLAEQRNVEFQAARHDVIAAAVIPELGSLSHDDRPARQGVSILDRGATRIARLSVELDRLIEEVRANRVGIDALRSGVADGDLRGDLVQLEQRLLVQRVELALLGSELFPEGSQDHVATSTLAETAATDAIGRLPPDSTGRLELQRLRALAALRSGDAARAAEVLATIPESSTQLPDPGLLAVTLLVDLASGRIEEAHHRVRDFYGPAPIDAPLSLEMDLATLRLRMASTDESLSTIGGWIDLIEQRHGGYARRRAEAMALAGLRGISDPEGLPAVADVSLVAAQGREWLRRGNPSRAGNLLASAALGETDPDQAIRWASESAAAFLSAGEPTSAAQTLAQAARRYPTAGKAAAAALQAAVIAARVQPVDVDELETHLRATIGSWPDTGAAESARQWLLRVLLSQTRLLEAAELLTARPAERVDETQLQEAADRWRDAFRASEPGAEATISGRFLEATRSLLNLEPFGSQWRAVAVVLVDRDSLQTLPPLAEGTASEVAPFIRSLDTFRRDGIFTEPLSEPPTPWVADGRWRLMRDARGDPSLRDPVARLLEDWPPPLDSVTDRGERLVWLGRIDEAVALYRAAANDSPSPGVILGNAAQVLGDRAGGDRREVAARAAAIGLWDQLAAGLPKGSEQWHQAKLAACDLLQQAGEIQDANRRAKYVLLTNPPESQELRQRYEKFTAAHP